MPNEGQREETKMRREDMTEDQLIDLLEDSEEEASRYRRQLAKAVDKLIELGIIDNLPHTRKNYATGHIEL